MDKRDLGWTTITHPFHPFRNQKFKVLKLRKVGSEDTIILQGSYRGTFAVPLEWTDRALPSGGDDAQVAISLLSIHCLMKLADLVEQISKRGLDR